MAFGSSSGPSGHEDEAPPEIHMAMAVTSPTGGAGDESSGDQQGAGGAGGDAGSQGGTGSGPTGGKGGSGSGGGEGGDWGDRDGFLPNGENGLMLLADYANSKGGGADQGDVPGAGDGPTGGDDSFGAGTQVADGGAPTGDEFQTAQNDDGGGLGFGLGGGGGGGSGGGGGGGGGGSGGGGGGGFNGGGPPPPNDGPPGGTESKPSPDGTGSNPIIVVSAPPPEGGDPCELINACDTGPINQFQPNDPDPRHDDPPGGGGGGGGDGGDGNTVLTPVPEPTTWLMLIVGFLGLGSALRVQRRKAAVV